MMNISGRRVEAQAVRYFRAADGLKRAVDVQRTAVRLACYESFQRAHSAGIAGCVFPGNKMQADACP